MMEAFFVNIGLICATALFGFALAFGLFAGVKAASSVFGPIATRSDARQDIYHHNGSEPQHGGES